MAGAPKTGDGSEKFEGHCSRRYYVVPFQQIKDNGGLSRLIAFIVDVTPPEEEGGGGGGKDKKKPGSKKGKKGQSDDGR